MKKVFYAFALLLSLVACTKNNSSQKAETNPIMWMISEWENNIIIII